MSIRQFSGRFFFRDRTIQLKIGGPESEDGQHTVIARDEATADIRIIRCDLDAFSFQELGEMVRDQFSQMNNAALSANESAKSVHH